ncbi:MAG TPA: hypothetical protein P5531_12985 [Bacteroidales bacterium]|nr:hypothetical protein [Bacteroidales bacterium]HSA44449.1 hypothetical protein [Bacteroidales bacterium]
MKTLNDFSRWTLHHTWVIFVSYFLSIVALLFIHDAFGFSMADDGTYLSNAVMHVGSGLILALGTAWLQWELLHQHISLSVFWVWSLMIGFVLAESVAGIVLWKLEICRGLINIFNTNVHYPEALIFALAGFIAGMIQFRLLKPFYRNRFFWIIASTFGWAVFILSSYLGRLGFILGAVLYGVLTGLAFYGLMKPKIHNEKLPSATPMPSAGENLN